MADISDDDRDAAIRTMLTEAAPNDPEGWAGVGNVIINRALHGNYPSKIKDIVTQKNSKSIPQFEVWGNGRAKAVSKDDTNYEAAGRVFDSLVNGMPDNTNGATHFYAPKAQAALGRNPPKWDNGKPIVDIGGQRFFAPEGSVKRDSGIPQEAATQTAATDDEKDFMAAFGLGDAPKSPAVTAPVVAAPSDDENEFKKAFGLEKLTDEDKKTLSTAAAKAADPGMAVAFGSGAASGVPIAGPAILSGIVQGAGALTGQNPGAVRESIEAAQAAHPVATTAGNIAGGVAGLAPVAAIAPGLIGGTGATLGARALTAMPGNALISGTDAAVRSGGDPLATATGAGVGAIGGALAPVVGKLGNKAGSALAGLASKYLPVGGGISRSGGNMLNSALRGSDPAIVGGVLNDLGPQGMLLDAGNGFKGLAQGIVGKNIGTEPANRIINALEQRKTGANSRLNSDINNAIGQTPTPSHVQAQIEANQATLGPEYQRVMQGASAVDTTPLANALDASIIDTRGKAQSAIRDVRGFLNIPGTDQLDPNPQALLATRHAIDGMLTKEDNPDVIRHLTIARNAVDTELTSAVPGIKDVDAAYQELARQSTALASGNKILDSGKTAQRPNEVAEAFANSANPAGTLVGPSAVPLRTRQGARAEIDRLVGTKSNDLSAVKNLLQGEGGWNTDKLRTVFGDQPANALLSSANRESTFATSANDIIGGSQSAQRIGAAKLLDDTQPAYHDLSNATTFGTFVANPVKKAILNPIIKMITENPTEPRNAELARIITTQGPESTQLLNIIQRFGQRQNALASGGGKISKALDLALTRFIQGGAQSGGVAPAISNRLQK